MTFPPAIRSLPAAIELAIRNGSDLATMRLEKWAETYSPATVETIRAEWERQLSLATQEPNNKFEENE